MRAELKKGRGAQNLGGTAGVLLTRQLQQQLIVANGLKGGFTHPQPIDSPVQYVLNGLQLLALHALNRTSRQDLKGQLTAPAQVETQLQWERSKNSPGCEGQGQDQGKPPLLTCHFRPGQP